MLYLPPYPRRPVTKFISANAQHPGGSHEPAHGAEHAALRAPLSKTTLMGPIAPKETRFDYRIYVRCSLTRMLRLTCSLAGGGNTCCQPCVAKVAEDLDL